MDQSESGDKTMDFIDAHEELFELPQQVGHLCPWLPLY